MTIPKITLRDARVNANSSQRAAADLLGGSVANPQNYESGKTVPDWDMVKEIESVYSFPADYVISARNSAYSVQ